MTAYTGIILYRTPNPLLTSVNSNKSASDGKPMWNTGTYVTAFVNVTAADVPTGKAAALAAWQAAWIATEQAKYTGTDSQELLPGLVPTVVVGQAPEPLLIKLLVGTVSEAPGD